MNKPLIYSIFFLLVLFGCTLKNGNINYKGNIPPLKQNAYIKLPLGAVKPEGWLRSQLEAQAAGLTGHVEDFWPVLVNSSWHGGNGEAWERGPYYLDGLIPTAYLLNDTVLISKADRWIKHIIQSSTDSGWYGPAKNKDRWPLAVANKVLMQYYEVTGDTSALNVLIKYFRYLNETPPDWPDKEWRGVRAMENAVTGYWLYRQTGKSWILETIESIFINSPDWTNYYEKFPWDSAALAGKKMQYNITSVEGFYSHGVNNAMAIKYPGLWYQQSGDIRFKNAVFSGIEKYDLHHGQAGGRFSADEHLSGKSPVQGSEMCSVVEYMFSMEELYVIFGDNSLADRLEMLAFNSFPGTTTPDMWAHQYDQQSNQVLVSIAKRNWSNNGDYDNIYGLRPSCCLANMHQGWPKFIESMWMATNDNGLAIVTYGPSVVKAKVARGMEVTIKEETNYPFNGTVVLTINSEKSVSFPLYLRVPGWADSIIIKYKGRTETAKGIVSYKITEKWTDGDKIHIEIPMNVRTERRFNNSISVLCGPLYFSLRIDKNYRSIISKYNNYGYKGSIDWEITPESPWNYALVTGNQDLKNTFKITEHPLGKYPFSDKGDPAWSADSGRYITIREDAPVVITTTGAKFPRWILKHNSADIPPFSPVLTEGQPEIISLVPYGCARLRITEFPVMDDFPK